MGRFLILAEVMLLACGATVLADQPSRAVEADKELTKATFLITGLHCPPCTTTVEKSLSHVKGLRSIKVDWKTKTAQVEFDETDLPAQKVAQLIAATPHMMGGNTHYGGWLAIRVEEINDDATAKPVREMLGKIEGVKQTVGYPKQHAVGVQFADKGRVSDRQLIDALTKAGYHAANL